MQTKAPVFLFPFISLIFPIHLFYPVVLVYLFLVVIQFLIIVFLILELIYDYLLLDGTVIGIFVLILFVSIQIIYLFFAVIILVLNFYFYFFIIFIMSRSVTFGWFRNFLIIVHNLHSFVPKFVEVCSANLINFSIFF